MNYLILIALMLFGTSCSEPEIKEAELSAIKGQHSYDEEFNFLNGFEMYKRSAEVQLFEFDELIAELTEAMEAGERGHEEEFENAQRKREIVREFQSLLDTFRIPFGGRGPGPRPPKGCFVANCNDGINIHGVHAISIPEGTAVERLEIKNNEGEIIGKGTEFAENEYGDLMIQFESHEFNGIATIFITTTVSETNLGEIMIEIPVVLE